MAGARFGHAAGTAGDVNGDGFSDFVTGAPGVNQRGEARVYLGSAQGLSQAPSWIVEGSQQDEFLGQSVASAGDVNGDGYHDILVGSPGWDGVGIDAGKAQLFLGSPDGVDPVPFWEAEGNSPGRMLGLALDTAGDLNRDGMDDFIIGSKGEVYVFFGNATAVSTVADWSNDNPGDPEFGRSVSWAGDVDADGFPDIIVGGTEIAHIYAGSATGLPADPSWLGVPAVPNADYGAAVCGVGDTNGDGYADVAVGAPAYDDPQVGTANIGQVLLYLGGVTGPEPVPATAFYTLKGGGPRRSGFGSVVETAGDVNGDGRADLMIGSPGMQVSGVPSAGEAHLYLAIQNGWFNAVFFGDWAREGAADSEGLGQAVGTAGDVDGDGFSDVFLGVPGRSATQAAEGSLQVFRGIAAPPSLTPHWTEIGFSNPPMGEMVGTCVSAAGDVNGDGYADLLYGSSGVLWWLPGSEAGPIRDDRVRIWGALGPVISHCVYLGDVNGDGYSDLAFLQGDEDAGFAQWVPGSSSGPGPVDPWFASGSPYRAGDVNGDGYLDLLVARHGVPGGIEGVDLYFGSSGGLADNPGWSIENGAVDLRRNSLIALGDVNADGYDDFFYFRASDQFDDQLFLGSPTGPDTIPAVEFPYTLQEDYFPVGDLNGDGHADLGRVTDMTPEVFAGTATGFDSGPTWTPQISALLMAPAGDIDRDGYDDLLISDPFYLGQFGAAGRVAVLRGSPTGPVEDPYWTMEARQEREQFARAIDGAGDVNADGYPDILLGSPFYDDDPVVPSAGRVDLFYAAQGVSRKRNYQQVTDDVSRPVDLSGLSDKEGSIRLQARAYSPEGRARVRLEWQIAQTGTVLDGTLSREGQPTDTGVVMPDEGSVVLLSEQASGLRAGNPYHWRVRVLGDTPEFQTSPWLSLSWNGVQETDVRMAGMPVCSDGDGDGFGDPGDIGCANGIRADCDDGDAQVYPGAPEACDGIDSDCDGEDAPGELVAEAVMLLVAKTLPDYEISWSNLSGATGYDVVVGDLLALLQNSGDYAQSIINCAAANTPELTVISPAPLPVTFFIVRAVNCVDVGTYSSFGAAETGSRDPGIQASPNACP